MANNRIFYACQGVALAPIGTAPTAYNSGNMVHGLQSIGVTTNFNLEQVFELGQIDIYENIEGLPDVEVTLEKVLDGYPLIYHMATSGADLTNQPSLAGRSKQRADLRLFIADEGRNNINSSIVAGDPRTSVYCSGMFVSSISYSLPVDGNFTESVTLVGNNKKWFRSLDNVPTNVFVNFDSADEPLAYTLIGSGGVQRREDFILADSILPTSIDGVNGNVAGNGLNGDVPRVHLQNVTVSTDFSREDILELGRKLPYYRPANFPIEVTCEIEAISVSGDFVDALEDGRTEFVGQKDQGNNLANETIYLVTRAGYAFDLGSKNKLSSVSYGGGDAGGGNVSCTYSYSNFNVLDVQQRNRTPFGFGVITAAT